MKLKEIHRTSAFAWSPASAIPVLATGTVAGALDESFSNDSRLEIWCPDYLNRDEYDLGGEGHAQANHSITIASRFNRLAWGAVDASRPQGVLAAGMESGDLGLWDPEKIVAGADVADATIHKTKAHDGAVRGLDFNPIAKNLLASGATNGQIFVWDLKDPSSPYSPGGRSSRLDEITALSWNSSAQQILATSSSTGYTVVWDLRGKREVVALSYSAGGGPMQSNRRGQSAVAWHPNNSTRLVTASEDDASPIIMLWDLRNARAPEKVLNGHEKGILSLSWCKQDADLLLSCGKDSRTIVWNPQSAEIIGELPAASNWAYQVEWCPRDPEILATASFDGSIGIHSLQSTNQQAGTTPAPSDTDDVFAPSYHQNLETTLSLKQTPQWMKRPVNGAFGYGGLFVTVSNLPGASGQHQSCVVHLRPVATEDSIITRAKAFAEASKDATSLATFASDKATKSASNPEEEASWKALSSLFDSGSRDQLIALLGFSKEKVAAKVSEAINNLQGATPTPSQKALTETTPTSETAPKLEDKEEETKIKIEPEEVDLSSLASKSSASLFGDVEGTPTGDAEADFFSSMGAAPSAIPPHLRIPHSDPKGESSAAATQGSPTSVTPSEIGKSNTFRIYPDDESNVDKLVTQALVLGDFTSAVELCLSAERYADAILLAVKGGPELLRSTQQKYFERSTTKLPYLRLYHSIVGSDLADIVQNADLKEWQEVFVIVCTYATQEEFSSLVEQLGIRLEFQGSLVKGSGADDADEKVRLLRKHATLCYLAAGNLEKVVNIWIEEMAEEQDAYASDPSEAPKDASKYTAHAQALQTFMEKVTVFRSAVKYKDVELENPTISDTIADSGLRTYKLSALYDRYMEYADLLATQGLVDLAVTYVTLIPKDYNGGIGKNSPFHFGRERILIAAGKQVPTATSAATAPTVKAGTAPTTTAPRVPAKAPAPSLYHNPYSNTGPTATATAPSGYSPYNPPVTNTYGPMQPSGYTPSVTNPYATQPANVYNPAGGQPLYNQHSQPSMIPAPPLAVNTGYTPPTSTAPTPHNTVPPPIPAALRKDIPGWNDPPMAPPKRAMGTPTAPPITNPLPNSPPVQNPSFYGPGPGPGGIMAPPRSGSTGIPPPPRAGATSTPPLGRSGGSTVPPPPKAGAIPSGSTLTPHQQPGPYGPRPGSVGPTGHGYDVRPPSTGPQAGGRYAPPPRADSADPSRAGIPPPPMKRDGPGYNVPPVGGAGPYGPPVTTNDPAQNPRIPPPPRASGASPIVRTGPPAGGSYGPPPSTQTSSTSVQQPPPVATPPKAAPKYPPGDRSHIPDSVKGVYEIMLAELENFKKIVPKRTADDVERRMNILFDSLNCATLSVPVVQQLMQICDAFEARNPGAALQIHLQLLTEGSRGGDDITVWMPALKQLCQRMLG